MMRLMIIKVYNELIKSAWGEMSGNEKIIQKNNKQGRRSENPSME